MLRIGIILYFLFFLFYFLIYNNIHKWFFFQFFSSVWGLFYFIIKKELNQNNFYLAQFLKFD